MRSYASVIFVGRSQFGSESPSEAMVHESIAGVWVVLSWRLHTPDVILHLLLPTAPTTSVFIRLVNVTEAFLEQND